ncbi:helix-turn-helix domain-containing protein [Nocardia cerradoensis]|nr:helix-turn-helix domain-containing protein [Nocardia cerradoensis]NKY48022.1 hypothetical protein [Nocardia cerradoensis]
MSRRGKDPAGPGALAVVARVRGELDRRGMDQQGLAAAIGRSTSYVSTRMRGELPFDLNDVENIAIVLEIPYSQLIG